MTIAHTQQLRLAVVSDAAPARNGVGAYYLDLVTHLRRHIHQVEIFSPTIEADGRWQAGMVLPLPGDSTQKMCMPNPISLQRSLRQLNPHVVIVPTPGCYGLMGAFIAQSMNIPVVAGFHTSFEHLTDLYWQGSIMGKVARRYFEQSNKYLFSKSSEVLANSREMVELAERIGAESVKLVGTPIPAEFVDTPVVPHSGELKRCLFAGRLAAEKNVASVLLAAKRHRDIQFTVAGDGPMRKEVEAYCDELDNLHYVGWLSRAQLRQQMDANDALLLPSYFESFGTIALEAMARQRIAIVSTGCGISQWQNLSGAMSLISEQQTLTQVLSQLKQVPSDALQAQAAKALSVASEVHEWSISDWLQLLGALSNQPLRQVA
ncbi:glycosyltransferase [Salinibius halmophilus]|uniref:glycosyltransferase n=1 Tax=Salinibius halmophilus TaxID=1853216 RepID=UPI000E673C27|nr:glycosyltransferase [Salinibius halmophilus]